MKPDLSKLRARLQALRNMTTANGCTEAEAMAAAEKAAELLAASGLSAVELDASAMEALAVDVSSRRTPLDAVWKTVALFAECRGYFSARGRQRTYVYFGDPGNILVAEYVHEVIRRAAASAAAAFRKSDAYLRRKTDKTRRHAQKAFLEGFAESIQGKLAAGLWRRKGYDGRPLQDVVKLIEAERAPIDAELRRRGVSLGAMRELQPAQGRFKGEAHHKGASAGRALQIDAAVAGGTAAPRLITAGDRS